MHPKCYFSAPHTSIHQKLTKLSLTQTKPRAGDVSSQSVDIGPGTPLPLAPKSAEKRGGPIWRQSGIEIHEIPFRNTENSNIFTRLRRDLAKIPFRNHPKLKFSCRPKMLGILATENLSSEKQGGPGGGGGFLDLYRLIHGGSRRWLENS